MLFEIITRCNVVDILEKERESPWTTVFVWRWLKEQGERSALPVNEGAHQMCKTNLAT